MCVCACCVYVGLRALEMLQEINQSVNRKSSYSKLAMTSLLNSNLSVKYNLTGHLASTDVIIDGFYDAGKVCSLLQTKTFFSSDYIFVFWFLAYKLKC